MLKKDSGRNGCRRRLLLGNNSGAAGFVKIYHRSEIGWDRVNGRRCRIGRIHNDRTGQTIPLHTHAHQHIAKSIVAAEGADDVALASQYGSSSRNFCGWNQIRLRFVHGGGVARPAVGDQIGLTIGIKGDCGDDATRGTIGSSRG